MDKTQELKILDYFGISDIGIIREKNEDSIGYFNTVNGELFVVCDGIGGYSGGEIASKTAVNAFHAFFNDDWKDDMQKALQEAFDFANTEVINAMFAKNMKSGTTACVALVRENKIYYAHIGDSRIYYKTGKKIFQLTKDHSYIQQLIDNKKLSKKQAKKHSKKNEITKALGIFNKAEPDIFTKEISPADNDYMLLCSDGLSSYVSDKAINSILEKKLTTKQKTKELINIAEDKGSDDNISVQLVFFYNTNKTENNEKLLNPDFEKRKRNKKLSLIGISIIFIILFVFLLKKININSENTEIIYKNKYKISSYLKKQNKDSIISVYIKSDKHIQHELENFNLDKMQVGHATALRNDSIYFLKFYIPVQDIIITKPGQNLNIIAKFYKINPNDILKANNKQNLYIKPGEKLIIPIE